MTEENGELIFYDDGIEKIAKWSHLLTLYKAESTQDSLLKLSKLSEKAVMPKHTEKQSVSFCIRKQDRKTIEFFRVSRISRRPALFKS